MCETESNQDLGNLAAELTSFVGRRREATQVSQLISASRLVTLTGVGGVGKTRLALRVGAEKERDFRDGVWFVDLAPLDDAGLVTQSVALALGLQDGGMTQPVSALKSFLKDKTMLLILDNCEHLRDSCALLVDALLRRAPGLRVLATSRQSLGLTGEHVLQVPPLSLPEETAVVSIRSGLQNEAVNLFVQRARAIRPTFELTDDNVHAVSAVCRRLDGVPLAIEMAAARLSVLSVHDLLGRLEDRFALLTCGSTAALPRHQTLRELIRWSWELCTDDERTLWARASMFPSEFDLAAAEAVCIGGRLDGDSILEVLTGLGAKTILMVREEGAHVRYRMLEILRQYGQSQLQSAAEGEVRERHRAHYRRLASVAHEDWFSVRQKERLDWFRREHSNVRLALETSFAQPALVDSGLEMVDDLWGFWFATGRTSEARHWLERGLSSASVSTRARARALGKSAYLSVLQQDLVGARAIIEELETAAAGAWDRSAEWSTTYALALAALSEGELARAEQLLEEAHAAHASKLDPYWSQNIRFCQAIIIALKGDLVAAEALGRECIQTSERHGECSGKSYMLWCLGFLGVRGGRPDEAAAYAREALRLGQLLEEPWVVAACFELQGWIASAAGEPQVAARLLGAAQAIWSRTGAFLWTVQQLAQHHDQCLTTLRAQLGDKRLAEAMVSGAEMSWEQSIAEALSERGVKSSDQLASRPALGSLTTRESEVAELIAQGLTNKEIAARLVVAQRTAEGHVERILNKLGFMSRVQVAAWVVEQRAPVAG